MITGQTSATSVRKDWKHRLGMGLFIYSLIPICTVELVAFVVVYLASGEIALIAAVALLGKPFIQANKLRKLSTKYLSCVNRMVLARANFRSMNDPDFANLFRPIVENGQTVYSEDAVDRGLEKFQKRERSITAAVNRITILNEGDMIAGVGDFNGDLTDDLLIKDSQGGFRILILNARVVGGEKVLDKIPGDTVAGIGILTGEGEPIAQAMPPPSPEKLESRLGCFQAGGRIPRDIVIPATDAEESDALRT